MQPGYNYSTTTARCITTFPVSMRIAPTALEQSGTAANYAVNYTGSQTTCSAVPVFGGSGSTNSVMTAFTVASGLTAGQGSFCRIITGGAYLAWSAEL